MKSLWQHVRCLFGHHQWKRPSHERIWTCTCGKVIDLEHNITVHL